MTELYINQKLNQLVKLDFDDMASNPLEYVNDSIKFFIESDNVVNDLIDNLFDGDEEAYQVIKLKYIDKCTWLQVALQMNMGERTVQRIRDNIIKKQLFTFR